MSIANRITGLFKGRGVSPKPATTTQRRAARELVILQDDTGTGVRDIALGLVWRPLMLANGARQAAAMAKEAKASHYVILPSKTIGYGILPKRKGDKNKATSPATPVAALAIGRLGSANALLAIDIGQGETWICILRNQRPEGAEEIVRSDTADEASVVQRVNDIRRVPGNDDLQVYSDVVLKRIPDAKPLSLADLTSQPSMPGGQLQAVAAGGGSGTIPKPILIGSVLVGVAYMGNYLYTSAEEEQATSKKLAELAESARSEDPSVAWKIALAAIPAGRNQPNVTTLALLSEKLASAPVNWLGWELKQISCTASERKETGQPWACQAGYEPALKGKHATNLELSKAVPAGMQVEFLPTTRANLSWAFESKTSALDAASLPMVQQALVETASSLQNLQTVLTEPPTYSFAPIKGITAPTGRLGQAIERPKDMALPQEARLVVNGPLRVIDSLIQSPILADWKTLTVTFKPDAASQALMPAQGSLNANSPTRSALMLTLEGSLYASR